MELAHLENVQVVFLFIIYLAVNKLITDKI